MQIEQLLTTEQAAELCGVSAAWFIRQRWLGPGNGPRFLKIGRSVRYRPSDLREYFERVQVGYCARFVCS